MEGFRVRMGMGTPLPERVRALLSRPAPSKTARVETFTSETSPGEVTDDSAPVDASSVARKRFTLEDSESLTIRSSSRSPRDEYLVAYQKHRRRGIHVWEVQCSAHRNNTIQGLVRVEVVGDQTSGAIHMSGLTFAINIRRSVTVHPSQLQSAMCGSHYLVILDTLSDNPTIGWARDNRIIAQEHYHGDELSFYLFLLEIEAAGDYEVVTQYLGGCYEPPLSLERLSRVAVRRHLQSLNRLDDIKHLPLPSLLRDFVEQADKLADES